ncbi:MAG TPA: universal stress protein [Methanoregula sp.]|nr:universal stress protein [Methanoregula sp.]
MFTNILVALDGSKVSQRALIEAVDLARLMNAKIQAVHVMEAATSAQNSLDQMDNTVELYHLLEREGNDVLEGAKKYCSDKGINVIPHLKQGTAGTEIISLAEQEKCDLIVVASHGKSGFDRLFLGSVSSFVVKNNKGTTLVVRG